MYCSGNVSRNSLCTSPIESRGLLCYDHADVARPGQLFPGIPLCITPFLNVVIYTAWSLILLQFYDFASILQDASSGLAQKKIGISRTAKKKRKKKKKKKQKEKKTALLPF